MYEHLKPLIRKLLSLEIQKPPPPWKFKTAILVGGLCSIMLGYALRARCTNVPQPNLQTIPYSLKPALGATSL